MGLMKPGDLPVWYATDADLDREARAMHENRRRWACILEHWPLVEADLHQFYGIDLTPEIVRERTWRWLRGRIEALFALPPVISISQGVSITVPATRIGLVFDDIDVQTAKG